ncbi:MAG TPA: hypothetical protein VK207_12580 [Bacteroidales bacterium]|nr:hypothetical protein [Bacteroidales bacterium]
MKHFYSLVIMSLFLFTGTRAQNPIVVSEDNFDFGSGDVNGYSVVIPEVDYETTLKNWIKYLESGTRSKVVQKGENLSIFGAKVKPVSDDPVNVYSMLTKDPSGVKLQAAFELERDRYAGATEYANARKYLFDFAKDEYMAVVSNQLNEEQKILRSLEGDLRALKNDQEKMQKSNESGKGTIEEETQRLADLKSQLASLSPEEYHGDSAAVTGMGAKSPDQVKDLEKERKKINREISSAEDRIQKAQKEIAENERTLPGNLSEQETAKRKVEDQQQVVSKLEKKVDTIKSYK